MVIRKRLLIIAVLLLSMGASFAQTKESAASSTQKNNFIGKKTPDFTTLGFSVCSSIIASESYYNPTGYNITVLVKDKNSSNCHKPGERYVFLTKKERVKGVETMYITDQIVETLPANTYFSYEEVVDAKTEKRTKYLVKYSTSHNRLKLLSAWSINKETSKFDPVTVTSSMQIRFDNLGC